MACRGTGRVISGLGGTPHEVVCPWCEGSGHRIPGIDAQEHPSERGAAPEEEATPEGAPAEGAAAEASAAAEDATAPEGSEVAAGGEPPAADAT
jgi:hypothetical protein